MDASDYKKSEYQSFLEEVRWKLGALENAIKDVADVKSKLKATASEVKTHIRESVSRQLEALRNREVWLINQVEIIQNIKEEILRQQQADLNQGLGQLTGSYCLLQQGLQAHGCSTDLQNLCDQVQEVLNSLEYINLSPDESSEISFVADNFVILQAITQYGRVGDTDSIVEKKIASSLEEQKIDQHKFFLPGGKSSDWLLVGQQRSFLDDWHYHSESEMSSDEFIVVANAYHDHDHAHSDVSSEVERVPESDLLEKRPENLKHLFTIMESDDADWIMKRDPNEEIEIEVLPESPLTKTYEDIKAKGMQKWLKNADNETSVTNIIETYRQICNSELHMWLKENQGPHKASITTPMTTYTSIMMSKKEKWLRNNENCEIEKPSILDQYDEIANSGMDQWLSSASLNQIPDEEPKNLFPPMSEDLADWLLGRTSVPTTVPVLKEIPGLRGDCCDHDQWLAQPSSAQSIENLKASELEKWLRSSENDKPKKHDPSRIVTYYLDSIPSDYNHWLSNPKPSSDLCKWLSRQTNNPCKNCPQASIESGLFPVFNEVSTSNSGWLITDW